MDRREALRRLAASGAVAIGASTLLSSNVAASSGTIGDTCLRGIPGPGEPLPIRYRSGRVRGGEFGFPRIRDDSHPMCICGGGGGGDDDDDGGDDDDDDDGGGNNRPTVTYSWRINGYDVPALLPNSSTFEVRRENNSRTIVTGTPNSQTCTTCPTAWSSPNTNDDGVRLRKVTGAGQQVPLGNGDSYDLGLIVTWQCQGAQASVTAEYRIFGVWPAAPTVENLSYVIA